eukprot:TRINITY_DN3638_c0_g1_i2.p1 TRINITY_DN3638_c0_g1~~TRINITY_DN3638_c0_g1_i2.p1  ORF type:complete len:113 (+),score=6.56 TRINITY_DN3638_c0_g1_i2:118-456(+)
MIEAFGSGTAAVVSPVNSILYQDTDYDIPINEELQSGELTRKLFDHILGRSFSLSLSLSALLRKQSLTPPFLLRVHCRYPIWSHRIPVVGPYLSRCTIVTRPNNRIQQEKKN